MKFIESKAEYDRLVAISENYLDRSRNLPDNIFCDDFSFFLFITFDEVRMDLFYEHVVEFSKNINEDEFFYVVLDPAPESYGIDSIIRYKAIYFSIGDSGEQFISVLNKYSGGVEPDCIMDNSDQILVSSNSQRWFVFADRDSDIGVCCFSDSDAFDAFKVQYGNDLLPNVAEAAEYAYGQSDNTTLMKQLCSSFES